MARSGSGLDVGTTIISFDLTNVPGTLAGSDLRLMINNTSNFSSSTTFLTGSLVRKVFTVTSVNLTNGQYFTLGSTNPTSTPLRVELVDFNVKYTAPVVIASCKTATEFNNDHFTLERSGPTLSFEDIIQIPGTGNSKTHLNYHATDDGPIEGFSYYRLKQTDRDGTYHYSNVMSVYIPYTKRSVPVLPNPREWKTNHTDRS